MRGIGGHQRGSGGRTDEWLTPPPLRKALGAFDLDPCSPVVRPWPTARRHFTIEDDGLSRQWRGRVWMNPPYGRKIEEWMRRMAGHNHGTALVFARTETEWFHEHVWKRASALLFLRGRVRFYTAHGRGRHKTYAPKKGSGPRRC